MKLAIITATYQRKDGTSFPLLTKALESVLAQTHQDYKLFLIGDKYEDNDEFLKLATSTLPPEKIYYENLPTAVERERYPQGGIELWRAGGVNAMNYGISKALEEGYEYVCHLDHDDYWHPQHLELINYVIDNLGPLAFVYTLSTYFGTTLPKTKATDVIPSLPTPARLIHSSVCINHSIIPFKYRDVAYETGNPDAADADLWKRISKFCVEKNHKSYLIPRLTCFHPTEDNA